MPAITKHIGRNHRLFLRFGLVGLLNTGFGYVVFAVLVLLGIRSSFALVAAALAGTAFNFQTYRRLVFRSGGDATRFVIVYAAVLALDWGALQFLRSTGLSDLQAQMLLTLPIAVISFLGQRHLVFGPTGDAG
jgi:putative flippase GtrA